MWRNTPASPCWQKPVPRGGSLFPPLGWVLAAEGQRGSRAVLGSGRRCSPQWHSKPSSPLERDCSAPWYFQDCAARLSSLKQIKKRCSRGGCHSFNNSSLFPRDFMHLTPIKTRGTPTSGAWPALCLTPADIWNCSFRCHLLCSLLLQPMLYSIQKNE